MGLVTLADVKIALNDTTAADEDELAEILDDAVDAVEQVIGPIAPRTVVEEIDSHGSSIVLSTTPVLSVESVSIEPWLGATALDDTAAWRVNTGTGVLRRRVAGGSLPFYGRGSIFTVTYTAGRTEVPFSLNRAILLQVRDMWKPQRGAMPMPVGGEPEPMQPFMGSAGFLGPEVMELLRPFLPPPGAA